MSKKEKYEVVSVDVSSEKSVTEIDWLAITTDSHHICPYVVLEGPIFKRLCGYHLIRKDLNFARDALIKLQELQNTNSDALIEQSLWFASAVSYGKCFTDAKGRGVKLEKENVFKGAYQALLDTHDMIMHERHQYISHAGETNYEITNTMLALSPDEDNKKMFGLYHSMYLSVGILSERIRIYLNLINHVKNHIEKILDKLFPVSLNEAKKTDIDVWYRKAKYPIRNIAENAKAVNLTAPTGGVLRKIFIRVEITPESAGILVYGAPNYDRPVRFNGSVAKGEIYTTEPNIYIQQINGVEKLSIHTLGYEEQL